MRRVRALLIGVAAVSLCVGGAVVAGGMQQSAPQDAQPSSDPIGDILRQTPPSGPPAEAPPAATPAPAAPVAITPPVEVTAVEDLAPVADPLAVPEPAPTVVAEKIQEPEVPARRQRRPIVIVEAIDKVTAERMRFEVAVGGRPVRFNNALIFSARACEVAAPGELVEDSIAYLDVSLQPRGTTRVTEPRQIFRGWMFASTPAVSGLQHPVYDAWVVGCKA